MVWDFVRHFIKFVRKKDPVNALGVGHTFIEDTEYSKTGEMVDIIIFHAIIWKPEAGWKQPAGGRWSYSQNGKWVINNETGCSSCPIPMIWQETADRYGLAGIYLN